jgi:hypothetical protein
MLSINIYLGVTPDLYDNNEEEVRAFLRGE